MTLRDYFAAHAAFHDLSQMIPNSVEDFEKVLGIPVGSYESQKHYAPFLITLRFKWADMMLAERAKRKDAL